MAKATKKAAPKKAAAKKAPAKAPAKASKPAAKKTAAKKVAPKKAAPKKAKRQANPAFMAPLMPDAALGEVVGSKPLPRTEIVKKIWDYMKKQGLQDKKNKRMINADAKLRPLFKKEQISMFELAKLVNEHVKK
jgi:upstream activation factor subunit UAF30